MLLLGVVKEVRDLEIVLNLPGGSTGFLAITDISDIYTKHLEELSQGDVDSNEEVGHVCATLGRWGDLEIILNLPGGSTGFSAITEWGRVK